jgi:hypothetical protein
MASIPFLDLNLYKTCQWVLLGKVQKWVVIANSRRPTDQFYDSISSVVSYKIMRREIGKYV